MKPLKYPSPLYPWVKSRQLEGTWPGSMKLGACLSTSMRVGKGWGAIDWELWPDDGGKTWPITEPPGIDLKAKSHRIGAYQRVNTVEEFRIALHQYGAVQASFEIDDSWVESPKGLIQPPRNQPITGIHCICLMGYDDRKERFIFPNSWGGNWGRHGLGFLPYTIFRHVLWKAISLTFMRVHLSKVVRIISKCISGTSIL